MCVYVCEICRSVLLEYYGSIGDEGLPEDVARLRWVRCDLQKQFLPEIVRNKGLAEEMACGKYMGRAHQKQVVCLRKWLAGNAWAVLINSRLFQGMCDACKLC